MVTKKTAKYYVGVSYEFTHWNYEVFKSVNTPTKKIRSKYIEVIGPFKTKRGAEWYDGPDCTITQCEKEAKKYAKK